MMLSRRSLLSHSGGLAVTPVATQAATVKPDKGEDHTMIVQAALDAAAATDGLVVLGPGTFHISTLRIVESVSLLSPSGKSILQAMSDMPLVTVEGAARVVLQGVIFDGGQQNSPLVTVNNVPDLHIRECHFRASENNGLSLNGCGGIVSQNIFNKLGEAAIAANESVGLTISENTVSYIDNNGIQVWTSEPREDGTIVSSNRVSFVRNLRGGSGQYGNGISVFRAGSVHIAHNHIADCSFSAIRINSGENTQIIGNKALRSKDTAIYVEFASVGAVVSNNLVDDAETGITMTNFDVGGRLGTLTGNLVRNVRHVGLYIEADALAQGNVIENAAVAGLAMGWGPQCPNLTAQGNLIKGCAVGIQPSVSAGAGPHFIANNVITGSKVSAIRGMDHDRVVYADLSVQGAEASPAVMLQGNFIRA